MTNQEAMRGRPDKPFRVVADTQFDYQIVSRFSPFYAARNRQREKMDDVCNSLNHAAEEYAKEFALQEVASRDARIAELRKLFPYIDHSAGCISEQFRKASDIGCSCGLSEILKSWEALKEQP